MLVERMVSDLTYTVSRESFESISHQWEQLLPRCETESLFLAPLWQQHWWSEMGQNELVILAFRQGRDILGIAPLSQKDGHVSLLGQKEFFDYRDFIAPTSALETFLHCFIDFMRSAGWQSLSIPSLPGWSPTFNALPGIARAQGFNVEIRDEDTAPGLRLPSTWDEYLSVLSKKDRHELRRKLRRLDEATPWRHYICKDASSLPACMADFFRLMRQSREEKDRFLTPSHEAFMLSAVGKLTQAGIANLYFLEVAGVRVASAICFDYGKTRYLYNSGFDPSYGHLSVGLLLKALCLKDAIESGMSYFDFLRGNERYKYHLGGQDRAIYEVTVRAGE
ncbi:MAG: GNAT family N-acetyltransferase [Chloroflexi bacterium]|nr:GNAT family N-acetyltransferase [Chloroflexota bacterium]